MVNGAPLLLGSMLGGGRSAAAASSAAVEEALVPLLQASDGSGSSQHSRVAGGVAEAKLGSGAASSAQASVDARFLRRFMHLMAPLRPYPALLLVLLSVVEALVVARVGKVAGSFYKLVVDREAARLTRFFLNAGGLYVVVTIIRATNVWLSELLALRWRGRLTSLVQEKYCQNQAYYWLTDQVDNPDQRIAADLANWCTTLAELMQKFCAAPLQVLYYSWLTHSYTGLPGLGIAYAFFTAGLVLQRLIIAPIARLVFVQERLEGDFRAAHVRVHNLRAEVALYRGDVPERAALEEGLTKVIANAGHIVSRHWLLETTTKGLEYIGALINYMAVALVVFRMPSGDSGADAELVSNASFATLTLIYAFTQLLDTAEKVSNIAGYTARVSELLEHLEHLEQQASRGAPQRTAAAAPSPRPSQDGTNLSWSRCSGQTLVPPGPFPPRAHRASFELSVHQVSREMALQVVDVFPEAPVPEAVPADEAASLDKPILVIPTFQVARRGVDLAGDCSDPEVLARVAEEMDRMLDRFLGWAGMVVAALQQGGHWANAVDPRTGLALYGQQGGAYSEARGAASLLGFEKLNTGVCDVISHPVHGTRVYPATMVTDAPLEALQRALQESAAFLSGADAVTALEAQTPAAAPSEPLVPSAWPRAAHQGGSERWLRRPRGSDPLLALHSLCVDTPAGVPAVARLDVHLRAGEHLLVVGPSGCGKSTLLRALAELWSAKAGRAELPPKELVMFLPQRGVLAPALTLVGQLLYPSSGALSQSASLAVSPAQLRWLLQAVGLADLWDRAGGDWERELDWLQDLSPGELQRLSIARVLARRPVLALLDESTSAVPPEVGASLYTMMKAAGVTLVSVSHQPQMEALHSKALRLEGDGTGAWALVELSAA